MFITEVDSIDRRETLAGIQPQFQRWMCERRGWVQSATLADYVYNRGVQLHPSLGSYYTNVTGIFRGDIRYYNLSSIPYDTNVTWKPIADQVMENANLSAIPERLGTWDWSAADTIELRVHDRMMTVVNVSENMAIVQVLCPPFSRALILTIAPRGNSS